MIKLTQQELEICYILSRIFDFGTDYEATLENCYELVKICKESLQDETTNTEEHQHWRKILRRTENKEQEAAIRDMRSKYYNLKDKIIKVKSNFSKDDLDRLFPLVVWVCWSKPSSRAYFGVGDYDFWDKEDFIKEILKLQQPIHFLVYKIFNHLPMQITKNHYLIVCFVCDFVKISQKEQDKFLKKDISLHFQSLMIHLCFILIVGISSVYLLDYIFGFIFKIF